VAATLLAKQLASFEHPRPRSAFSAEQL